MLSDPAKSAFSFHQARRRSEVAHERQLPVLPSEGERRLLEMAERPREAKGGNPPTDRELGDKQWQGFTDEERAAMAERAQEIKAAARRGKSGSKADGESDVLAKIAAMPDSDRALAEKLHSLVKVYAPDLTPRTWYGMPAYSKGENVVCFFQGAYKFKARYATLGFSDKAHLDDGVMWPTSYALKELTATEEATIASLLKQATR